MNNSASEKHAWSLGYIDPMRRLRGFLNSKNPARRIIQTETAGRPVFAVPSEHYAGVVYDAFVDEDGTWKCTPCPDFSSTQRPCKHIFEVLDRFYPTLTPPVDPHLLHELTQRNQEIWYADARRLPKVPFEYKEGPAESTRRDHALEEEIPEGERLVLDLATLLNRRHPYGGIGSPGLSVGHRAAQLIFRHFLCLSMRKFRPTLKRWEEEGVIPFAPRKSSLVNYNIDPEMETLLKEAFEIVTDPFRLMETTVIVDSTGDSPFYVANWRLSERGEKNMQRKTEWLKIHWVVGRESKAPLGFRITPFRGKGSGDTSNFIPLISDLRSRKFDNVELVAVDNMYLTKELWEFCRSQNMLLVSPMKGRNFTEEGIPKGAAAQMIQFALENPKLYDEIVRERNIIEGLGGTYKKDNPHIAEIGRASERKERRNALQAVADSENEDEYIERSDAASLTSLYQSRINAFYAKMIAQVLRRTVMQEHLRNRRISYSKGSVFSHVRELSDEA